LGNVEKPAKGMNGPSKNENLEGIWACLKKINLFQDYPGEKTGYRIEVKTSSCKLGMPPKIYFSEKKLEV
tara:strand:- start:194 stop:403 length:210 start_codon:yes stop_codon:yes gene_type:complete